MPERKAGVKFVVDTSSMEAGQRSVKRSMDEISRSLREAATPAAEFERQLKSVQTRSELLERELAGTRQQLDRVEKELEQLREEARKSSQGLGSVTNSLKNLAVAVVGSMVIRQLVTSFIDAAREAENYEVRLRVLLRSQEEGNRLFQEMADFAGRVPFEFRDVMGSATQLAGVLKGGVDEIAQWMPLIGDLAAASGLGIQEATGQVIRMLSAGAGAADLFRERGILAMLGFTSGVSYSAEQTKKMLIESWTDLNSQWRGATDELTDTWTGATSMLSDAWFKFRVQVMDQGPLDAMKQLAAELLKMSQDPGVAKFAADFGSALATMIGWIGTLLSKYDDWRAGLHEFYGFAISTTTGFVADVIGLFARVATSIAAGFANAPTLLRLMFGIGEGDVARMTEQAAKLREYADSVRRWGEDLASAYRDIAADIRAAGQGAAEAAEGAAGGLAGGGLAGGGGDRVAELKEGIEQLRVTIWWEKKWAEQIEDSIKSARERRKELAAATKEQAAIIATQDVGPSAAADAQAWWDQAMQLDVLEETLGQAVAAGLLDPSVLDSIKRLGKELADEEEKAARAFGAYIHESVLSGLASAVSQAVAGDSAGAAKSLGITLGTAAGAGIGFALGGPVGANIGAQMGQAIMGGLLAEAGRDPFEWGDVEDFLGINELTGQIGLGIGQISDALRSNLDLLMGALSGGFFDLPNISIDIRNDGQAFQAIVEGEIIGIFSTAEAAMAAGLRTALEGSLFGISEEVAQVFADTSARSIEALQAQVEVAQHISDLRAGITGTINALRDLQRQFESMSQIAKSAGLDTGPLVTEFLGNLQDYANQLRGYALSEAELHQQRANDFAAYLDQLRSQIEQELSLRLAQAEAAEDAARRAGVGLAELNRGLGGIANNLPAILARIAELEALLAGLPDFDPAQARPAGGGGGGRRELRERLRDEAALFGVEGVERQILDAQRAWEEYRDELKRAKFSQEEYAKLLAAATAQREREIEAIRNQVRAQVEAFANVGPGSAVAAALAQTAAQADQLREDIFALGLAAEETDRLLRDVANAEAERNRQLAEQSYAGAQEFLAGLLEATGREEEAAELRWQMELARYKLDLARYRAEFELLGLQTDILEAAGKLLDEFEAAGPPAAGGGGGGGEDGGTWWRDPHTGQWHHYPGGVGTGPWVNQGGAAGGDAERERQRAMERVQGYLELQYDPYTRALRALNEEFEELRDILGDTAEVTQAYELALDDLNDRYLSSIRDFYESLTTGPLSPLSTEQQYQEAQARYAQLLSAVEGGDLSQAGALSQAGQQLLQLGGQVLGTAGGGYADLFEQIRRQLAGILGEQYTPVLPGYGTRPTLGGGTGSADILPFPGNNQPVVSAISATGTAQVVELRAIRDLLAGNRAATDRVALAAERGNEITRRGFSDAAKTRVNYTASRVDRW